MLDKQRINFLKNIVKRQKAEIDDLKSKNIELDMELKKANEKSKELDRCIQKYNFMIQSVENIRNEYDEIKNKLLQIK